MSGSALCPATGPEAVGTKKHSRFLLNLLSAVKVTKEWHLLPREFLESPALQILNPLFMTLCSQL